MKMMMIIISIFFTSYTFAGEIFDQDQSFLIGNFPAELAIGDLNNDGRKDIAIVHWSRMEDNQGVMLFYQTKFGDFSGPHILETPGIVHAFDIKIADVNRDKHNDLLLAITSSQQNGITTGKWVVYYQNHKNNKLGKLKEFYTGRGTRQIEIADLNGDKRNDVVVYQTVAPRSPGYRIIVYLQNKKRKLVKYNTFDISMPTYDGYPTTIKLVDINGDGTIDILSPKVMYHTYLNEIDVFNIDGEIVNIIDYRGKMDNFQVVDLDENGYLDIIYGDYACCKVRIMLQDEDGFRQFAEYNLPKQPQGLEIGDINDDGKLDFIVNLTPEGSQPNHVWRIRAYVQKEDLEFELADTYETFGRPWGIKIADVMNDGKNDILFLICNYLYMIREPSYLHAFFKNPPNPKPRHPKKSKSKARGIERAIEVVSKSGSPRALEVLESKVEKSAIEQTISAETEEDVPEVLNGKDEDEIILTNTIEAIDRKNTEKPPFKCISIAIFRVWAKVIELGNVYYLKNGKLEEFN